MPHRSVTYLLFTLTVLLILIAAGFIFGNWESFSVASPSVRWLAFLGLLFTSQVLMGGVMWWLFNRKRQPEQTDILHSIVHEFQSPITAIRMAADILDSPIARNQPERTEKYVRIIREEADRLQQQVETMLTLARADKNTLVLNTEPIHVNQLVRSVAERHGAYLTLDLTSSDPHVLADRLHLTNVFYNLLDNAVKYSASEPEITISTKSSNDGLTIAVKDQGIGMAPKTVAHIFQPFFRVHDRNQPSVKGFGLGLSYVQRIIQSHNWTIWVKSEVGKGSEFLIQVPLSALMASPSAKNEKE